MPVLAAQAIYVRQTALELPEPPGARQGNAGSGDRLRLLILGDSSAAGVGAISQSLALSGQLEKHLSRNASVDWLLEAETGATTKSSISKLSDLPPHHFDLALLVHGVNDTTRLTSKRRYKARQIEMMDRLRESHKIQRFILSGVPPMHHFPLLPQPLRWVLGCQAERLDAALAELAAERDDCTHLALDLPYEPKYVAEDGFHPSEEAYHVWAGLISERIRQFTKG